MNPLSLVAPAVEPVTVAEMRAYLRLEDGAEDALVAALVVAARVTAERQGRIALLAQTWRYALSEWPEGRAVRLPLGPAIRVDAVRLSGEAGPPVALDPGLWRLDHAGDVARLVVSAAAADPGGSPPRIEIDFTAGFGTEPAAVPEPLRLAVRRLAAHWFERRGDEMRPGEPSVPADVRALVAPFARPRLA